MVHVCFHHREGMSFGGGVRGNGQETTFSNRKLAELSRGENRQDKACSGFRGANVEPFPYIKGNGFNSPHTTVVSG